MNREEVINMGEKDHKETMTKSKNQGKWKDTIVKKKDKGKDPRLMRNLENMRKQIVKILRSS